MDELIVRALSQSEYPLWDTLVSTSPQGTVFLKSDFLQMLCTSDISLRMSILGGFDSDGELKAGQPFVYRNL
ncbi:MAG TPA: hypothetical protein VF338_12185, partial [Leptolinea sp.]